MQAATILYDEQSHAVHSGPWLMLYDIINQNITHAPPNSFCTHSNMCPTTSLLHRCTDTDNVAILGANRCVLLTTRGVVLCDVAYTLEATPTAAVELPGGVLAIGDAQGAVFFLRLGGQQSLPGMVARMAIPQPSPTSITALTHLEQWGGFASAWS